MISKNKRTYTSQLHRRHVRFSRINLGIISAIFAAIGAVILIHSFAAPNPNLPGDLNNDNTVNALDLSILLSDFGTNNSAADINGDGTVNVLDLSALLSHYGQSLNSGTTYYVDCSGSDNNSGTSTASAWKSLTKADSASLKPGDSLLLKRGCTWNGQLTAKWSGSSSSLITIGAYGTGNDPLIQGDAAKTSASIVDVSVTGTYQKIQNIQAAIINPALSSTCIQSDGTGVPLGWYVGFSLDGSYNTLSNLTVSSGAVGVAMGDTASNNHVLSNHLFGLHYLWQVNETSGALGGMGIDLHGNNNEIAYNLIEQNGASCTFSDGVTNEYSAALEVYNANGNYVHHNRAYGHKKHFEMGHDSSHTTNDNVLAYNLFVSNYPSAVGPNIHGNGSSYGPVNNTQIYNNTIVFTGANSQAIVCGCDGGAVIKNNILIAEWKAAYYSGSIIETNNDYWDYQQTSDTTADPFVQFSNSTQTALSPTSIKADPQFINWQSDFHLQPTSPDINTGTSVSTTDNTLKSILGYDLDNISVPQGTAPDIGAYEFH